jgi:septum formation inhibitor MinC
MSFVEAAGMLKAMSRTKATAQQAEAYQKPDSLAAVEQIVSTAKKRQKSNKSSASDSERLRGIRDNRLKEKEAERDQSGLKTNKKARQDRPADVVPIRSPKSSSSVITDYPDLDAFLEDDDD